MDCDSAREAISARIDGEEEPGPLASSLDDHLSSCPACREWQQRAHVVTRRARLGGSFLDHDLAPALLAAVPAHDPWWRRRSVQRGTLLALALAQLAIAAPMLFLGHDREAGVHAAHELGSFNAALAVAFAVGALRPRLSAGLAWPCGITAVCLAGTAIADLASGQAIGADEMLHLVAVAGAALLAWQSRTVDSADPAVLVSSSGESLRPAAGPGRFERDSIPPEPPGGHAARLAVPDIAAQAPDGPPSGLGGGSRGESVA
jgi:predicted anti-sigma-YlaC factor YlaD